MQNRPVPSRFQPAHQIGAINLQRASVESRDDDVSPAKGIARCRLCITDLRSGSALAIPCSFPKARSRIAQEQRFPGGITNEEHNLDCGYFEFDRAPGDDGARYSALYANAVNVRKLAPSGYRAICKVIVEKRRVWGKKGHLGRKYCLAIRSVLS